MQAGLGKPVRTIYQIESASGSREGGGSINTLDLLGNRD